MNVLLSREPVAIVNAVRLVALAGMTFGLHLTDVQLGASMLALEAVLTLFTRAVVTSPNTLQNMTPQTLANAQDAAQPVKDTIRKLPVIFLALALLGAASSACAGKVVGQTPIATAAIQADAIVIRVNELQATVIQACGPAPTCAPGSLDTALARTIVQTCLDLRVTLKAVPAGWQAAVKASWATAHAKFAGVTHPVILAAIVAVDVIIGAL